jgi:hypothetical protein
MKHEEVVAALKTIANDQKATGITNDDLLELKKYNLISLDATEKVPVYTLTKKGKVMLKANSKEKE